MQEKEYYTMLDIGKELGMTKQAIFWHWKRNRLPAPALTIGQTVCWKRRDALRFMSDYRAGKYPHGPVKGSKMPRKHKGGQVDA